MSSGVSENPTWREQLFAEVMLLSAFVEAADRQGLSVPGGAYNVLVTLDTYQQNEDKLKDWPPTDLLPALALARHSGLPTQLLDWTTNPYIAAYFAASSCLDSKHKSDTDYFAVWAYDINHQLGNNSTFIDAKYPVFKPAYSENWNLRSQSGLLMAHRIGVDLAAPYSPIELDIEISKDIDKLGLKTGPIFTVLACPKLFASITLSELTKIGISCETLYHGYGSAVTSAFERTSVERTNEWVNGAMYSRPLNTTELKEKYDELRATSFPRSFPESL